jgi:hypothetical protein
MQAIILTEAQAAALAAAREPNAILVLEPRRLQDGRLILNAGILDDPYYTDPSRPWSAILGISTPEEIPADQSGQTTPDLGAPQTADSIPDNSGLNPRSSELTIVTLTDADLEEPQR